MEDMTAYRTSQKRVLLFLAVVFIVNLLAYMHTVGFGFLKDDHRLISENPRIKSFSAFTQSLGGKFFTFPDFPYLYYWRPLTMFSFYVDYQLWGTQARGYHLSNIILNAVAGMLALLLLRSLSENENLAFGGALVFSLHPVHTEAAAWISGRTDLLAAVFILAGLFLFMEFLKKGHSARYAGVIALFTGGLLSKENAVLFPLAAFALVMYSGYSKKKLYALIPLLGIVPIYGWLHNYFSGSARVLGDFALGQIGGMIKTAGIYAKFILSPSFLEAPYFSMSEFDAQGGITVLFFLAAVGLILWVIIKRRIFRCTLGTLFFLLFLLPVINPETVPSYPKIVIRFAYLAVIPVGVFLWELMSLIRRKSIRKIYMGLMIVLLLLWGFQTLIFQEYFRNDEVHYEKLAAVYPEDPSLLLPLALLKAGKNETAPAMALVNRALAADEKDRWIYISDMAGLLKANLLILSGEMEQGRIMAERIEGEAQKEELLYYSSLVLSKYYEKKGDLEKAKERLLRAAKAGVTPDLFYRMALIYAKLKRYDEALDYLERAAALNPDLLRYGELKQVIVRLRNKEEQGK